MTRGKAKQLRALIEALSASLSDETALTGAHDAYSKGDKVTHSGKRWTSDVDNNTWEPGVYGWTEVASSN